MTDTRCTNPGMDNYFTCPACYADHEGYLEGTNAVCECGASLRFSVEYQPVAVTEIDTGDEA